MAKSVPAWWIAIAAALGLALGWTWPVVGKPDVLLPDSGAAVLGNGACGAKNSPGAAMLFTVDQPATEDVEVEVTLLRFESESGVAHEYDVMETNPSPVILRQGATSQFFALKIQVGDDVTEDCVAEVQASALVNGVLQVATIELPVFAPAHCLP